MTLAPLVVNGKVMVGVSGGEFGVRGFVAALDAKTGKEAWKTYTVPGPGEPGTTPGQGDAWKTGGALGLDHRQLRSAAPTSPTGAPATAAPWLGDQRPGDNLYTSSAVALDADTGKIKGHHQYHWNDSWDWDEVSPPMLIDFERDGRTINGLVHAGAQRLPLAARAHGRRQIGFVDGKPFVQQNVFTEHRPEDRPPDLQRGHKPGTGKTADVLPVAVGRQGLAAGGLQPEDRLLYIPANENLCGTLDGEAETYVPGQLGSDAA